MRKSVENLRQADTAVRYLKRITMCRSNARGEREAGIISNVNLQVWQDYDGIWHASTQILDPFAEQLSAVSSGEVIRLALETAEGGKAFFNILHTSEEGERYPALVEATPPAILQRVAV